MTEREALRPGDRVPYVGGCGVPVGLRRRVLSGQNAMAQGVPYSLGAREGVGPVCLSLREVGATFHTRILRSCAEICEISEISEISEIRSGRGGVSMRKEPNRHHEWVSK